MHSPDPAQLQRATFRTSRLLDFFSEKEPVAQTGHYVSDWPLVVKELIDNALEACEETGVAPVISVAVNEAGIEVPDNGPGLPADTTKGVLDYTVRVSSREAYVSPTRSAQANAPTNSGEYPRKRSKLMKPPVSCDVANSFRGRTRGMGRHRSAPRLLPEGWIALG